MTPSLGERAWPAVPALSAPLTILGVERAWFILSLVTSVSAMNLFTAFFGPALLFAGLYALGWLAHYRDPQMLKIVAASNRYQARYDPGKRPLRARSVELAES